MEQEFIDILGDELITFDFEPRGRTGDLLRDEDTAALSRPRSDIFVPASSGGDAVPGHLDADYRLPEVSPSDTDALLTYGTEAIACYVSFHFRRRTWGIYLSERRVEAFAASAFAGIPGMTDAERFAVALEFVLNHERFHYWTDIAATQMEFAARSPVYTAYACRHDVATSPLAQTEEAIANARARARLPDPILRRAAEAYMDRQPVGYRDWKKYATPMKMSAGKRQLGSGIQGSTLPPWTGKLPFEWFFDERRSAAGSARIPLHLLPATSGGSSFLSYYERPLEIVETARFAKELGVLPMQIQRKWREKTKPRLEDGTWTGTDFKKVKGEQDLYRCRVDLGHRVHLRRMKSNTYEAITVGTRQNM